MDSKNEAATRERISCVINAIETAKPDRALVKDGFEEHVSLLGGQWKAREIRFYRNLFVAYQTDTGRLGAYANKLTHVWQETWGGWENSHKQERQSDPRFEAAVALLNTANSLAWGAIETSPLARDSENAWDQARRGAISPNKHNPFAPFLKIIRGGCLVFWVGRLAIHVVLATVHGEGRRVHRTDGPAIEYEDGSGVWCWHGVAVPKDVVLHPEKLTVGRILRAPNAEVRRVMIQRYGQERFVCDAKARVLDREGDNELVSIPMPGDPEGSLVALKLRCSSTGAVYVLRVPPEQWEVHSALAWTFGLAKGQDYQLQAET